MAILRASLVERCGAAAVQAAGLFALSGLLAVAAIPTSPGRVSILLVIAVLDLVTAAVVVACPWRSWPERRTAVIAWPAFALIGLSTWAFGGFAAGIGPFFVLFFAWLGLHHNPRQILWCSPLAAVAYAVPLAVSGASPRLIGSTVILMPVAVGVALLISTHVRALAEARERMAFQAAHDALTGLPNRDRSIQLLHAALTRGLRDSELVAVLYLDLDGFKKVNDTLGHQAGDALLRTVAGRLRAEIRIGDTAGRLGGDEFVVVLESVATEDHALDIANRIIGAISQPMEVSEGELARVGVSVGISFNLDGSVDADAVLREADVALYRAKNRGRGQVAVFSAATGLGAGRAGERSGDLEGGSLAGRSE
jgi:diguanylate cyclase (GGDEF)-like protein